ncbi:hypothetical protein [Flavobacterium luteum]|uniref:Uncharacterized protein n=1 Tax=Flavobacterium luteum TaxID=2026654 RepID=A0A7J5AB16_9FLAO|nr:hypothetical protein [Flavobacterium luteum]KAB1154756.1 hypothetical protein F6464_11945 [Flavobacterium luteum]
MKHHKVLFLLLLIASFANSQNKTFSIDHVESRDNNLEWTLIKNIGEQMVHFSKSEINLFIDKRYHLTIISKTDLPEKGIIYLCNDESKNLVTIMLIDNIKMYLYSKTKRFLINFENKKLLKLTADID